MIMGINGYPQAALGIGTMMEHKKGHKHTPRSNYNIKIVQEAFILSQYRYPGRKEIGIAHPRVI
jgi:hypothetical protein